LPPRRRYSWELEDELQVAATEGDALEPPRPTQVPVLWQRSPRVQSVVVPLRRPDEHVH
jgi:hypothetical protein